MGVAYYGTNIRARFGQGNVGRILLTAHWDTRPTADQDADLENREKPILGANDGASGVAVLLEIASILEKNPPPVGVDIILFDLEDVGTSGVPDSWSLGAQHFAKNHLDVSRYSYGINVDMVGDAQLEISREGNSALHAGSVLDRVFSTARLLGIPEFVNEPGHEIYDDHIPLIEAGLPAVNLIDFDYPDASNSYWHTLQDTPDKCSARSLKAVGTVVLHIIYASQAN
jgi:Zn-dependent M28 family amino/carboxypeptidase